MQPVSEGVYFETQAELDVLDAGLGYMADTVQLMSEVPPEQLAGMMRQFDIIKADIEAGRAMNAAVLGDAVLRGLTGNGEIGAIVKYPQADVAARIIGIVAEAGSKIPVIRDDPLILSTAAQMWGEYQVALATEPPRE